MYLNRVKEILASEEEITVKYHGIPVLIDSVDESSGVAVICQRGTHDEKRLVSIEGLEEK